LIDEWIAEVGEQQVLATVEEVKDAVRSGRLPSIRTKDGLQAYWESRRHQRA
jgi:hypothetical protein